MDDLATLRGFLANEDPKASAALDSPSVKVGGSTAGPLALPIVTNVIAKTGDSIFRSVAGSLRNPYTRLLPSDATIYIVYLNAQSQICRRRQRAHWGCGEPRCDCGV